MLYLFGRIVGLSEFKALVGPPRDVHPTSPIIRWLPALICPTFFGPDLSATAAVRRGRALG